MLADIHHTIGFCLHDVYGVRHPSRHTISTGYPVLATRSPHLLFLTCICFAAQVLKMSLTKMNCTVDVAEDGTQALEAVTKSIESNHPYQLILMDLRMPNMDGFEATRMLKEVMKYSVPIVALTAETGADVRERCKEIGFDKFVQKPLRGALLKSILDQFCQHVTE